VSERRATPERCADCGHSTDLHGARAGTAPGACHHPTCDCPAFVPPRAAPRAIPDPRHDRDLFLACRTAFDRALDDREHAYELIMVEVARWYRRAAGLPAEPEREDPPRWSAPTTTDSPR
jgi:hypothetical protein